MLHTCTSLLCTPLLYQCLISYHLSDTEDPKPTYKLIRRSLTALIHHGKGADQFSPVGDVIMFIATQKAAELLKEEDVERLSRMMEVTSAYTSDGFFLGPLNPRPGRSPPSPRPGCPRSAYPSKHHGTASVYFGGQQLMYAYTRPALRRHCSY